MSEKAQVISLFYTANSLSVLYFSNVKMEFIANVKLSDTDNLLSE